MTASNAILNAAASVLAPAVPTSAARNTGEPPVPLSAAAAAAAAASAAAAPPAGFPGKIAVVGTGAIGLFYGSALARAGCDVHFLARSGAEELRRDGIRVTTPDGGWRVERPRIATDPREIGPSNLVLVALKTTGNAALPALLAPLDAPDRRTWFVTLQNGMGNVECLARAFGEERAAAGLCFVCNVRTGAGVVENTQIGRVQFAEARGSAQARTHALAALVGRATGARCDAHDSLARVLWLKLCWNIPFNGLAIAARGANVAEIAASPPLRELARGLMLEISAAAAAEGVEISARHIQRQLDDLAGIGPYRPSSLLDYLAGRPVEVEAIWGEPLRRALANGVAMPRLETLHGLLLHFCKTA